MLDDGAGIVVLVGMKAGALPTEQAASVGQRAEGGAAGDRAATRGDTVGAVGASAQYGALIKLPLGPHIVLLFSLGKRGCCAAALASHEPGH